VASHIPESNGEDSDAEGVEDDCWIAALSVVAIFLSEGKKDVR
jgi:hypothetical protein